MNNTNLIVVIVFIVVPFWLIYTISKRTVNKAHSAELSINMDGATFFKTNEGNIRIKRETTYIWLLTAIFGAFELILLRIVVSDIVQGGGVPNNAEGIIFGVLIGAALFQNIRSLLQPSIIQINAKSRMVEIGRGPAKKQFLFSQIAQVGSVNPQTMRFGIMRIARMEIHLTLDNGEVIKLGSVSGVGYSHATAISRHIAEVTGTAKPEDVSFHQVHIDPQTTIFESKPKEKPMNFFKNLFIKRESFVPTPTQTVPGLEPIVVQAIENLYPNIEDQRQVFEYSLKYEKRKKGNTRILLALLSYTKGHDNKGHIELLVDLDAGLLSSYHFMMDEIEPIFSNMKAAEKWVESITKPQT